MSLSQTPILILAFNRPENMPKLFSALKGSSPERILFAVDGPRVGNSSDEMKVREVQNSIELVDWNTKIETRFRDKNLGLKSSVVDSVTWAIEKYGRVVVVEDDAIPGPDFYPYMKKTLDLFESDLTVGHVSGYNCVPKNYISCTGQIYRRSRYPESYAWGTWARAWKFYNDDIYFDSIQQTQANFFSKFVWKEYFNQAQEELISTWAFRWISSLWKNNLDCISPNVNLSTYIGRQSGTHTKSTNIRHKELAIESIAELKFDKYVDLDLVADNWLRKNIFKESIQGIIELKIKGLILKVLRNYL